MEQKGIQPLLMVNNSDNVKGWMAKTRIRSFQSEKSNKGDFDQ